MKLHLSRSLRACLPAIACSVSRLSFAQTAPPAPGAPTPAPAEAVPPGPAAPPAPAAEPPSTPAATPAPAPSSAQPAPAEAPAAEPPAVASPAPPALPAAAPSAPPVTPPAAAPALPLSIAGSLWSRYELREGYQEHGLTNARLHREGDYIVSRARFALMTTPVDAGDGVKVSGTFVPQAAYTWGVNTGANPTVSDHPALALYEGYASVLGPSYRLDAGRFAMNYGDALIIGDLGWNEAARAFNGARLRVSPGGSAWYVDGFATLINEGAATSRQPISGDTYFYGLYAGLGPLLAKDLALDVYVLALSVAKNRGLTVTSPMDASMTLPAEQKAATEVTFGARVKGKAELVDYRAEAGLQVGRKAVPPSFATPKPNAHTKLGYQIDGELGVVPTKGLRLALEGLVASGDDPTTKKDESYDELYPTTHKFLGLMDVIGPRTNVTSGVLHASYALAPVTLLLDAHYFARPQKGADGKSGSVGEEIDTNLVYAIGKGATARALYGIFVPTKSFWETKAVAPNDPAGTLHFFELELAYNFK